MSADAWDQGVMMERAAEDAYSAAVDEVIDGLIRVATGALPHRFVGRCPDFTQPDSRDPLCAACKAIERAES